MGKLPKCVLQRPYQTLFFTVERPRDCIRKEHKAKLAKFVKECEYGNNIDYATCASEEGEIDGYPHTHMIVHLKKAAKVDKFPRLIQEHMQFFKGNHTAATLAKAKEKNPNTKEKIGSPINISVWMGYLPAGTHDKTKVMSQYLTVKKYKNSGVDPDGMMTFIDNTCCEYCGQDKKNIFGKWACDPHPKYLEWGKHICKSHPFPAICMF